MARLLALFSDLAVTSTNDMDQPIRAESVRKYMGNNLRLFFLLCYILLLGWTALPFQSYTYFFAKNLGRPWPS
jgi:hypothetical protein